MPRHTHTRYTGLGHRMSRDKKEGCSPAHIKEGNVERARERNNAESLKHNQVRMLAHTQWRGEGWRQKEGSGKKGLAGCDEECGYCAGWNGKSLGLLGRE